MHRKQRLAKVETKLQRQLEDMQMRLGNGLLALFTASERPIFIVAMDRLMHEVPDADKSDPGLLSRHFNQEEIDLLNRADGQLLTGPLATIRESILTLQTALQACERIGT